MYRRPPSAKRTDTLLPYTTLFRSGPVAERCRAVHEVGVGVAVDVRQVGRCHPHLAPHLAVLKRGRQSVLLHVVEEVAHGLLGEIVEIGHLLETVEQIRRVKIGPVRSEEHTSELQSLMRISYAVFCLKKKK